MASTYTTNIGIEKPATGDQSGTWGETTNTNFDIIDQGTNGVAVVTLASAGTSGSPNSLPISNGALSDGRNRFIEFNDGGDLGATAYVQLDPNDAEKIVHIRNSLSASRSLILFQGTYNASNDFEVPNGADVLVKFDGGGTGATVTDVNVNLTPTKITTGDLDVDNININGNTISSTDTNGNLTIDPNGTGNIVLDANVGIGTASPSEQLHVIGDIIASGYFRVASNQQGGIFDTDGNNGLIVTGSTASPASNIIAYTGGIECMRIDSSGNVGIGSVSPTAGFRASINGDGSSIIGGVEFRNNPSGGSTFTIGHASPTSPSGTLNVVDAANLTFNTHNTERMRLDSSGNLLHGKTVQAIGTVGVTLVNGQITATADGADAIRLNRKSSDGSIIDLRKDDTTVGSIGTNSNGNFQLYGTAASHVGLQFGSPSILPINNSGSSADNAVDLGDSNVRFKDLYLSGTLTNNGTGGINIDTSGNVGIGRVPDSNAVLCLNVPTGVNTNISFAENGTNKWLIGNTTGSDALRFYDFTSAAERMRIDSSGNLLVGTTTTFPGAGNTATGSMLQDSGSAYFSRTTGYAVGANRNTTDGSIINIAKDGTTVGTIGTYGGATYYTGPNSGILFNGVHIEPTTGTGSTRADNTNNIGSASYRFRDLYLSNGVYLGGTGSANFLDDYEIGTWNPSFTLGSGTATGVAYGRYIKVGQLVYVTFYLQITSGSGGIDYITNLPFASENSGSWTGIGNVRETSQTGYQWHTYVNINQNYMLLRRYDNANAFAINYTFVGSVTYTTP